MSPDPSVDGSPTGDHGTTDHRTRRRRLVQDDLAEIAIRLFVERGYDEVSVDDIAEAAGMSQRTFFRYFPTKDEVLRRYRRSLRDDLVRALRDRPGTEGPVGALRSAYELTSDVGARDRATVHAISRLLVAVPELWAKDVGETVLDDAVRAELARRMGASPGDVRPAVVAAAVSGAALVGWNRWVASAGTRNPASSVVAAIDVLGLHD